MLQRLFLASCIMLGGFGDAVAQWRPGFGSGFRPGFKFLSSLPAVTYNFAGNSFPAVTVTRSTADYVQDLAGTWSAGVANTLRRTDRGAYVEPASTNSLRNSTGAGAVAGTPGTLPTNWAFTAVNGLTREVVGVATEGGMSCTDLRVSGTATATTTQQITLEANTQIAAAPGQVWSASVSHRLTAGSNTNVTGYSLRFLERSSGGTALVTGVGVITAPTSAAAGTQRRTATYTIANASAAFVQPTYAFVPAVGAIDFTVRLCNPQWELSSFATSIIPTSTVAVTRAADVATITVPAGYSLGLYTFDDGTTTALGVTPGAYVIPTSLGKPIRSLELYP